MQCLSFYYLIKLCEFVSLHYIQRIYVTDKGLMLLNCLFHYFNQLFIFKYTESLTDAGGNITKETVARHSQLVGGLGKKIDHFYGGITGSDNQPKVKTAKINIEEKLFTMVNMLKKQRLFNFKSGRKFKSFPEFSSTHKVKDPRRAHDKLLQLNAKLDRLRRIVN